MVDLDAIRARDAESGATWFTGPASFTAQSARDRRELLALVDRARDALAGMVGLVQLVSGQRYPDFPVDNHRVIEAQSCLNALSEGHPKRDAQP